MRYAASSTLLVLSVAIAPTAFAQGQPPPQATETVATAIPGVIAAGTKIEVIKSGFSGTEGPITLPDGSLIFTETQANRITKIDKALNQESEGFWKDLLTDVDGISLHRFQIVVWTLVLGFIFLVSVYKTLAMPEFGGTLVALMGISAGTYIGFKFPEKQV